MLMNHACAAFWHGGWEHEEAVSCSRQCLLSEQCTGWPVDQAFLFVFDVVCWLVGFGCSGCGACRVHAKGASDDVVAGAASAAACWVCSCVETVGCRVVGFSLWVWN
jgi:hypothetical protein